MKTKEYYKSYQQQVLDSETLRLCKEENELVLSILICFYGQEGEMQRGIKIVNLQQ
jgi:hypothetical protein